MQTELVVQAIHEGGMRVRASAGEFNVVMDYPLASSETPAGPTPLTMLLASLAACSVNSLMAVLNKMQQHVTGLGVEARALRSTEHPTVLTNIFLEFTVKGDAVDPAAVAQASMSGSLQPKSHRVGYSAVPSRTILGKRRDRTCGLARREAICQPVRR